MGHFVDIIPPEDRGDVVKGLAKAFSSPPRTDAERERLVKVASACVAFQWTTASRVTIYTGFSNVTLTA